MTDTGWFAGITYLLIFDMCCDLALTAYICMSRPSVYWFVRRLSARNFKTTLMIHFRKTLTVLFATIMPAMIITFNTLLLPSCNTGKGNATDDQPNILFILTDDQGHDDAGYLGNPVLETLNIDRLARESMQFTNAFTSTAMCVPSRTTLYTGLHPMRHGAHPNHAPLQPGIPTVAHYLEELGYKVGLIGKVHVSPIDSFGFHYMKELLDFAWDSLLTPAEMRKAMEALGSEGDPFALFVCISNPHTPWPADWDGDPAKIRLPEYLYDNEATREALSRYYAHVEIADRKVGEALEVARGLDLLDDMVVFFSSDHGAEFVHGKYNLYDAGIKVPFFVRWPGVTAPGSESDALVQFVDVVPTLIDIAGGKPVDSLDGVSILPLLEDPSLDHHEYIFATSSKDGNKTDYPITAIRSADYKYLVNPEYSETYTSWITDSTLGNDWPGYDRHYGYWLTWLKAAKEDPAAAVLVRNYLHRPAEELYDLRVDPHELHNLADDPAMAGVKAELRQRLEEWMISQGDVHYDADFFESLEN